MSALRLLFALGALFLFAAASAVAAAPGATTTDATDITFQSATLNGVANPNKEDSTYYFEYGTTTAYGSRTPDGAVSGNAGKEVSAAITGLTGGTVYHFRLVVTNPSGQDFGADKTFTTPASPYALPGANAITIGAKPATIRFGLASVISGQLTGPNNVGVQVQLQENPHPYTGPFKDTGTPVTTDANGNYSFTVKPGLHTRYQAVARTAPPVTSAVTEVRVRFRVSLRVSDSRVNRGQRVRFRGSVSPAHDGRVVRIQRRTRTGYKTVARTRLRKSSVAGRSVFSKRIRIYRKGTYRARVGADADHATGTSRRRTIRMN
jgi:hypothetical protein